jgi:hypothetical protein
VQGFNSLRIPCKCAVDCTVSCAAQAWPNAKLV